MENNYSTYTETLANSLDKIKEVEKDLIRDALTRRASTQEYTLCMNKDGEVDYDFEGGLMEDAVVLESCGIWDIREGYYAGSGIEYTEEGIDPSDINDDWVESMVDSSVDGWKRAVEEADEEEASRRRWEED